MLIAHIEDVEAAEEQEEIEAGFWASLLEEYQSYLLDRHIEELYEAAFSPSSSGESHYSD